jgi:hypothetical protein
MTGIGIALATLVAWRGHKARVSDAADAGGEPDTASQNSSSTSDACARARLLLLLLVVDMVVEVAAEAPVVLMPLLQLSPRSRFKSIESPIACEA